MIVYFFHYKPRDVFRKQLFLLEEIRAYLYLEEGKQAGEQRNRAQAEL